MENKSTDSGAANVVSIRNFDGEPSGEDDLHEAERSLRHRLRQTRGKVHLVHQLPSLGDDTTEVNDQMIGSNIKIELRTNVTL